MCISTLHPRLPMPAGPRAAPGVRAAGLRGPCGAAERKGVDVRQAAGAGRGAAAGQPAAAGGVWSWEWWGLGVMEVLVASSVTACGHEDNRSLLWPSRACSLQQR